MRSALILALIIIAIAMPGQVSFAQKTDASSDAVGTYTGRQIGRGRGQIITLILMPGSKASIAIASAPGIRPLVSTGTWEMRTPGDIRISVAGAAGSGVMEFSRFGDQLTVTEMNFDRVGGFSLQLIRQSPIPGTYTAVVSGTNHLQTLTLQLNADSTASLKLEQSLPASQTSAWSGTWTQMPSGDIQVSISQPGRSDKFTLYRSSDGIFRSSDWNRSTWGSMPLVFVRG